MWFIVTNSQRCKVTSIHLGKDVVRDVIFETKVASFSFIYFISSSSLLLYVTFTDSILRLKDEMEKAYGTICYLLGPNKICNRCLLVGGLGLQAGVYPKKRPRLVLRTFTCALLIWNEVSLALSAPIFSFQSVTKWITP